MLNAVKPKRIKITAMQQTARGIILETEHGRMKCEVITSDIIRIVYTLDKEFPAKESYGLCEKTEDCAFFAAEDNTTIRLSTDRLILEITKDNGRLVYKDNTGKVLLAEPEQGGKYLIPYDSFTIDYTEELKVERIKTPDGEKEIIKEAKKLYDRVLYHSRMELALTLGEAVYGFGQQEEGTLNLRGTRQYVHQGNLKIAMPFMMSTNGYSLLLNTYSPFIFNDNEYGTYIYNEACEALDFYFIKSDTLADGMKGYRKLSGKAAMLPKWAFGFMQSLERYETQQEMIETVEKYRELGVPIDSIVLDWNSWEDGMWGQKTFDFSRFPDPCQLTKRLHELGTKMMISIWPNMSRKTKNYEEMKEAGTLLPRSEIYDAFREEGRKLYWKQANDGLFQYGIDSWWCDSSEPYTPEWSHKIKPEPDQNYMAFHESAKTYLNELYTNAYPLLHAKAIYEGQRGVTDEKRVTNLTRAGYTGQQKYGTILWSGDITAKWSTLKKQIPAGLNLCASGMPYWTLDIGAFFVKQGELWFWNGDYEEGNKDLGYRELYTRWYQYGAFLPVFRSHGTDTRREIWQFGEKGTMFYDVIEKFTKLRYRLMPYIYSLAGKVYLEDESMMRLLAFDFKEDTACYDIADQYMFGDSLMICPVTEPMYYKAQSEPVEGTAKNRTVYLPGTSLWYDFWTDRSYQGKQSILAAAPIDIIPVYVKAGAILPMARPCESTATMDESVIELKIYPGADGSFSFYQDKGDGYDYEKGSYATIEFTWKEAERTLTIGARKGSFAKMPEEMTFKAEVVGKGSQEILYKGRESVLSF